MRTNIGSIVQTDYGYTGQRNLDENIGLMDYKARFYSPLLNRFTQPDTLIPDITNSQSLNRFSYTINNPIRYNDPDGHCAPVCALVPLIIPTLVVVVGLWAIYDIGQAADQAMQMSNSSQKSKTYIEGLLHSFGAPGKSPQMQEKPPKIDCFSTWTKVAICGTMALSAGLKIYNSIFPKIKEASPELKVITPTPSSTPSRTPTLPCIPYSDCSYSPPTITPTITPPVSQPSNTPATNIPLRKPIKKFIPY